MLSAVPFSTRRSYLRAIQLRILELFVRGVCGLCGGVLGPNGWSWRKRLGLPVRRCRCRQCRTSFTLLPVFVATGKWYGYEDIDDALIFVTDFKYSSLHKALDAWENRRIDRIEDGEAPGPSTSTVARWHRDMAESAKAQPWQARTVAEVVRMQADHPISSQLPPDDAPHQRVVALVLALTALGSLLIRLADDLRGLCAIAIGFWCVEGRYRSRCFASPFLHGRVIPGPSPKVTWTSSASPSYPPRTWKSGGDP